MGEVAAAGLLAHVPTIMLPRAERLELNEGKEISLVPGLERLRREVFEVLDYDTVVVLDSHWHTTVEFVVAAQPVRAGLFTSDELPRIWERLYRGDRSRSERGLGLGLSLVQAIVRAHGGDVAVDSAHGRGSTFAISFPTPTAGTP